MQFVENIGFATLRFLNIFYESFYFTYQCLIKLFKKNAYNSATKDILVKQIYFTSVEILPLLVLIGTLFGGIITALIVNLAFEYGLKDHIGTLLINIIVNEFAPLATVVIIALRSGAAISTEIAVMKVSNELNTLKAFDINIIEYLFLPRIISGIISVVLLSFVLGIIMLFSGYLYLLFFFETGLDLYLRTIVHTIDLNDFALLFIKSIFFGFFVTLIPIYSGLKTTMSYTGIPISVSAGMLRIIVTITSIEVASLLIIYL